MATRLQTQDQLRQALLAARDIAVLGAHSDPQRAAQYVPAYLRSQGYRIWPVNEALVGQTLFDQPVRAQLTELSGPVDIVDVFRRAEALMGHLDEILAMRPLPRVVWLQTGIEHDEFAQRLMAAGIAVAQNVCTMAVHRILKLGPVSG